MFEWSTYASDVPDKVNLAGVEFIIPAVLA